MSEEQKATPQQIAEFEQQNMKDWKSATDALECSTFHGKHAKAIGGLLEFSKGQYEAAKKRLDAAIEQIKTPMPTFGKTAASEPEKVTA